MTTERGARWGLLLAAATAVPALSGTQPFVPLDDNLRVAEGVWAVGDLTGKGAFTHVGMYPRPGWPPPTSSEVRTNRRTTTRCPESRSLTPRSGRSASPPAMAAEAGIEVRGRHPRAAHGAGRIHKAGNEGFIELVEDRARGVLVGATAAGSNGGEVLGLLTLAVHAHVPVERLRQMIYAYPTFHRGIEDALRDLGG